jgi:hypothetical protein
MKLLRPTGCRAYDSAADDDNIRRSCHLAPHAQEWNSQGLAPIIADTEES